MEITTPDAPEMYTVALKSEGYKAIGCIQGVYKLAVEKG